MDITDARVSREASKLGERLRRAKIYATESE
jgi:hypothetical protein